MMGQIRCFFHHGILGVLVQCVYRPILCILLYIYIYVYIYIELYMYNYSMYIYIYKYTYWFVESKTTMYLLSHVKSSPIVCLIIRTTMYQLCEGQVGAQSVSLHVRWWNHHVTMFSRGWRLNPSIDCLVCWIHLNLPCLQSRFAYVCIWNHHICQLT